VPITLVHDGKHRTEDKFKKDATETKHNPEKSKEHKKQRTILAWFSRLIWHSARKRGGLKLRSHWYEYESRVRVSVYGSYKLHPYEWAFIVTCTSTTQRVSTDNLQKNRIQKMLYEKVTIFH